jgi:hypothetical protein
MCLTNELGDYVPPEKHHPQWHRNQNGTLSHAKQKVANAELLLPHIP